MILLLGDVTVCRWSCYLGGCDSVQMILLLGDVTVYRWSCYLGDVQTAEQYTMFWVKYDGPSFIHVCMYVPLYCILHVCSLANVTCNILNSNAFCFAYLNFVTCWKVSIFFSDYSFTPLKLGNSFFLQNHWASHGTKIRVYVVGL